MIKNNNQLTVSLSKPATRLLTELIKNNKIELTRDQLIKRVWEDYGFSPSSATLSNHISELRKAFEALSVSKDILLTVPRVGFKMVAEIHPETKSPNESTATEKTPLLPLSNQSVEGNAALSPTADVNKKTRRMKIFTFSLAVFLISLAIVIALSVAMASKGGSALVGMEGKCKIYALNNNKCRIEQLKNARAMLARERIDCSKIDRDIYYMEARPTNKRFRVYFMAACTKNKNMSYKTCNNYKLVE